jgi:glycosyltransferase involved in cell wall biosynthesis
MNDQKTTLAPGLSVVIPVYNGEPNLAELVERLLPVLTTLSSDFEIVLVNDGSADDSWRRISELAQRHSFVRGMDLTRNFGQHNALLVGVRSARFDRIVTMDDDLQHPPEEIPKLLAALTEDRDVVYGTPEHLPHTLGRNIASYITKLILQKAMGAETARHIDAFRAFRTGLREGFRDYSSPFVSLDVLLTWSSNKFAWTTVAHQQRLRGRSNYTLGKLVTHMLNLLTGFSTLPLQFASWVAILTLLFGAGAMGYALFRHFIPGHAPPGFLYLVSLISILSGAQLLALGIVGEYLARSHFRMMSRPSYLVRRTLP